MKTNQIASVGGKVLCYKYCRTLLSLLKRKIALHFRRQKWLDKPLVHVQETVKTVWKIFLKWRRSLAQSGVEVKALVSICLLCIISHMLCKIPQAPDHSFFFFSPVISRCAQGTTQPQTSVLSLLVSQNLHLEGFEYERFLWLFCGSFSKYSKQFKNTECSAIWPRANVSTYLGTIFKRSTRAGRKLFTLPLSWK